MDEFLAAFDLDGWCPRRVAEAQLPVLQLTCRPDDPVASEWESFGNFREALQTERQREWLERREAAQVQYRQQLRVALAPLRRIQMLPEEDHETIGSDVVGLLTRLSKTSSRERQLILLITDLADTRHPQIPALAAPAGDVRALVLLVPARDRDARLTLGRSLTGPEQLELRRRQLGEAVHWVVLEPFFSKSLADSFSGRIRMIHPSDRWSFLDVLLLLENFSLCFLKNPKQAIDE